MARYTTLRHRAWAHPVDTAPCVRPRASIATCACLTCQVPMYPCRNQVARCNRGRPTGQSQPRACGSSQTPCPADDSTTLCPFQNGAKSPVCTCKLVLLVSGMHGCRASIFLHRKGCSCPRPPRADGKHDSRRCLLVTSLPYCLAIAADDLPLRVGGTSLGVEAPYASPCQSKYR